jgi:glyoxylase-like metal-dependent hydrolase (beta-lactamase superfamily II)
MHREVLSDPNIRTTCVTDTLAVVHGNNRSRSPFSNAVYVRDRTCLLMDSGCGHDIIRQLGAALPIDTVLLSHSHPDHTSGTWLLQELLDPEVQVPLQGSDSIADSEKLSLRFMGPELAGLWRESYLPATGYRDFTFTSSYGHGTEFSTGKYRFIALHTPGHLEDHYCLWEPDEKVLVGFDIDLSPFGPWYGNPESDIGLFLKSLELIGGLPVEVYISSHARPVKPPHFLKRMKAYESVILRRDSSILALIPPDTPMSIDGILDRSPIYGVDYRVHPDRILNFGERQMILKHVSRLAQLGHIVQDGDGKYRKVRP